MVNLFETNLASFKKSNSIKKNFEFMKNKFYVTLWLDMAMNDEENKNLDEIKIVEVAYTAPPFKAASGAAPQGKQAAGKAPVGGGQKKPPTDGKAKAKPNGGEKREVLIPAGIKAEEIKDPDMKYNLWSVYY